MFASCVPGRLANLAADAGVPGVQFAVHHQGNTWSYEFGEQDRDTGRLLTEDTKIPIGSVTKTFTATLAMMLVSDGDLHLDTPIVEYLPELRRVAGEFGGQLTLRHLLSHTGGLPSDPPNVPTTSPLRHLLDCLRHPDLVHRPGQAFSYSNTGYVIAGRLVEAATGMSWWEAMEVVLLKQLGRSPHTVFEDHGDLASGHAVNPATRRARSVRQSLTPMAAPAGALAASASDLVMLGRLLTGTAPVTLLDPATSTLMRAPVPGAEPFGMADGWGLGLAVYHDGDRTWFGHDGTGDGTACHLRFEPVSGTVVALTTNGSTGFSLWHRLVAELREVGLRIGDYDGFRTLGPRQGGPTEGAGCYRNGDLEYQVREANEGLHLTVDGEPFAELIPHQGLAFAMRDAASGKFEQTGRFLRDPDGEIGWLQVGGRLARRVPTK
jgi:CubicO group peptidase (beta-lactamase class C family)